MRKMILAVIAVLFVSAAALGQQSNQEKVICELSSGNCLKQADLLQKRIKKLDREIKKGGKKYSAEDLKKLEQKLKETEDLLNKMEAGK